MHLENDAKIQEGVHDGVRQSVGIQYRIKQRLDDDGDQQRLDDDVHGQLLQE